MSHHQQSGKRLTEDPLAALHYEFAQEQAATLGRLGRKLEARLAELAVFDATTADAAAGEQRRRARGALVASASTALWDFIVQLEAVGLRDSARAMRDYGVPHDVRARMGAFPAAASQPKRDRHGS